MPCLFLPFISRFVRIPQFGYSFVFVRWFFMHLSRSSLSPQTPNNVFREASPVTPFTSVNWGVTAACVIARLLLRSGCGLVTVFEQSSYCALFLPYLQSQSTFVRYSISNSFKSRVFMSFSLFRRFGHFIPLSLIYLRFSKTCAR